MARLPRFAIPDQPQHIIQRGNNRQAIFAAEADYQFFREALIEAANEQGLAVHAYVFMTNHVHLLASPETGQAIGKVFQSLGRRYVRYFNVAYGRSGTLWEGRYRATVVDSERYLLTLMRYIELNPVRAGMVSEPGKYPWSSHRHNALGMAADWLRPHAEYLKLGQDATERQCAYRALFSTAITEAELAEIRDCSHKGWALGGERFKERMERLGGRPASSQGVGRPKNRG